MASVTANAQSLPAKALVEPSGPRPKRIGPGRYGVYAFLIISALFFLIPLYFGLPLMTLLFRNYIRVSRSSCSRRRASMAAGFWGSS
jgi:hypothetical protein